MRPNVLVMMAAVAALVTSASAHQRGGGGGPGRGGGRGAQGGGIVQSVDSAALSFVVLSRDVQVTVTTTSDTRFEKSDGSAATFADVVAGAEVGVQGERTTADDGSVTVAAARVMIRGGAGSGVVSSIDEASLSFVVDAGEIQVTVTTTAETVFQTRRGATATFADVVVGSKVLVQSTVTGENAVTATRVLIVAEDGTCAPSAGSGKVLSVDSATQSFVVKSGNAQVTVTTSTATVFRKSDGTAATFADVTTGAKVQVEGAETGTNTVDATTVVIKSGAADRGGRGRNNRGRRGR